MIRKERQNSKEVGDEARRREEIFARREKGTIKICEMIPKI
jgi:hypothetical protein